MKWTRWIKVVETDSVPKTRLSVGMFLPLEGNEKGALGQRIIEIPVTPRRPGTSRSRSGHCLCPVRQHQERRSLVTTGAGKTESVRRLPWRRFERSRPGARNCRPLPKLSRATLLVVATMGLVKSGTT